MAKANLRFSALDLAKLAPAIESGIAHGGGVSAAYQRCAAACARISAKMVKAYRPGAERKSIMANENENIEGGASSRENESVTAAAMKGGMKIGEERKKESCAAYAHQKNR